MKKNLLLFFLSICLFNAYGQTTANIDRDTYKSSTIIYSSPNYSTYSDCNKVGVDGTQNFRGALYYSLPSSLANATITSCSLTFSISSIIGGSNASLIISDLGTTYLPLSPSSTNWNIIASSTAIGTIPVAWNQSTAVLNTANLKTKVQNSINNSQFFIELGVRNGYSNLLNFGAGQLSITYTLPAPPPPTNLTFTNVTDGGFNLNWSSSSGATGYNLFLNGVLQTSTVSTSYNFTGLTPATNYTVGVSAYSSIGESARTSINKSTLPSSPSNVHITSYSGQTVYFAWDPSYGATDYKILYRGYLSSTGGSPNGYMWPFEPNTTYTIQVYATSRNGSDYSLPTSFTFTMPSSTMRGSVTQQKEIEKIYIYPNPTANYLNVAGIENYDITIFDFHGNKVLDFVNASQSINISHLKKGLYSVEIKYQGKIYKQQLIKE